jgi:hypothetical protein
MAKMAKMAHADRETLEIPCKHGLTFNTCAFCLGDTHPDECKELMGGRARFILRETGGRYQASMKIGSVINDNDGDIW